MSTIEYETKLDRTRNDLIPWLCINLKKDYLRMEYINQSSPQYLYRLDAIDGKDLSNNSDIDREILEIQFNNKQELWWVGQSLSHMKAWDYILNKMLKTTLILEDDVIFSSDSQERINSIKPPQDADIIFVGGLYMANHDIGVETAWPCHKLTSENVNIYYETPKDKSSLYKRKILSNIYCEMHTWTMPISRTTASYIVTPKGAKNLLELVESNKSNFILNPLNAWICDQGRQGNLIIYEKFPHPLYSRWGTGRRFSLLS